MRRKLHRHGKLHLHGRHEPTSRYMCVSDYILFVPRFNIIQKYIAITFLMWCRQSLLFKLIYSTFVSDLCRLVWCILYLIFIASHCNVTVTLVQHYVVTNGLLYEISYLYAAWCIFLSVILSITHICQLHIVDHS